jgi:hypothetical protein
MLVRIWRRGGIKAFQGTARNIKQEQQVMRLAFLSALPRPPAGPPASEEARKREEWFGSVCNCNEI